MIKKKILLMILLSGIALSLRAQSFKLPDSVQVSYRVPLTIYPVKSSYYCNQLGFFCKQELKLDKITVLPMRFRLGSLNYVNYLEQKPNARLKPF